MPTSARAWSETFKKDERNKLGMVFVVRLSLAGSYYDDVKIEAVYFLNVL